jgi:Mrp family chromosome partitioning ATPase
VSSYYEAMRRIAPADPREREFADEREIEQRRDADVRLSDAHGAEAQEDEPVQAPAETRPRATTAIVPLPTVQGMPITVARAEAVQRLAERLAPLAVLDNSMRLLVSGCRPGDGASTLASAFALDLSQRLSVRTLLIDAHIRHPSLHRLFTLPDYKPPELVLNGALQIRSSGWPRLELASCCMGGGDNERRELLEQFENVLAHYSAVVVDLGVVRLDTRMLPLARPTDPILLVARYGHTRRQELATTAAALRAANRAVAGVILNAATSPVASTLRKLTKR